MNIIKSRARSILEIEHQFDCDTSRHRLIHADSTEGRWEGYSFISQVKTQGARWIGTTDYYRGVMPMIAKLANWCEHNDIIVKD